MSFVFSAQGSIIPYRIHEKGSGSQINEYHIFLFILPPGIATYFFNFANKTTKSQGLFLFLLE